MNRGTIFNYIEEKLGILAHRINSKGKLNILDLHIHSEDFYLHFLNKLYGWNLENQNAIQQNVEAIDLIDHTNKLILQVSATNTKQKVEVALKKDIFINYPGYTFKFVSISKDADDLRTKIFSNPHQVIFIPKKDIIDNISILKSIQILEIDPQKEIYGFIKKELGGEIDILKLDSNLTAIIIILSKENLNIVPNNNLNAFEIERKIAHNKLDATRKIIEDWIQFSHLLNTKYQQFDNQGANKSLSVIQKIRSIYVEKITLNKGQSNDSVFLEILESIKKEIMDSANFDISIPVDELDLCINIIVVDTFIRCKIFENPDNYSYENTNIYSHVTT